MPAIAYGVPAPSEARPPDSDPFMPRRIFRSRAYQLATEPESAVMIAFSGSRLLSSQNTRCGLIGSAECIARASSTFHQSSMSAAIVLRQASSGFCSSIGSSAAERSALSPIRLTSIG